MQIALPATEVALSVVGTGAVCYLWIDDADSAVSAKQNSNDCAGGCGNGSGGLGDRNNGTVDEYFSRTQIFSQLKDGRALPVPASPHVHRAANVDGRLCD